MTRARVPVGLAALVAVLLQGVSLAAAPQAGARSSASPGAGRRLALLIGNDTYGSAALQNARRDARAIAAELQTLGFQTTVIEDANSGRFKQALESFSRGIQPSDLVLFFYAGHGAQYRGENYLLPVDYSGSSEQGLVMQGIPASQIQVLLSPAQISVLVLDACRNNPYAGTRSGGSGLAPMEARGSLVAFATGANQTASDNPGGLQGRFTGALLEALREPGLSIQSVFLRAKMRVYELSSGAQFPAVYDQLIGEVVLRPETSAASALPLGKRTDAPAPVRPAPSPPAAARPGRVDAAPPTLVRPPAWMVGDFRGVNTVTKAPVELTVQPDGVIKGVSGAGTNNSTPVAYLLTGENQMQDATGAYFFEIEKNELGFRTRQVGAKSNVVEYRRVYLPPGDPATTDARSARPDAWRRPSPDEWAAVLAVIQEFTVAWPKLDVAAARMVYPTWDPVPVRKWLEDSGIESLNASAQCSQITIRRDQAQAACQIGGKVEFKRQLLSQQRGRTTIGGKRPPETFRNNVTYHLFWNGSTWLIETAVTR